MSLETVLSLGRLYRTSQNSKDYHELINKVSRDVEAIKKKKDASGNSVKTVFYQLPVTELEDGSFDIRLDEITELTDEDKISSLYYLNFKTSGKDAEKRYLFGDIIYNYFPIKGDFDEGGNYRLIGKSSSFVRCEELAASMSDTVVGKFRTAYALRRESIEQLLLSVPSIVLHFDFSGRSWYELPEVLDLINAKLMTSFVGVHEPTGNVFLEKYLYKTLGGTTPGFGSQNTYKTKLFKSEEVQDLMYAVGLSQKTLLRIKNIGVVALPKGENLSVEAVNRFLTRSSASIEAEEEGAEERLSVSNQSSAEDDDLLAGLVDNDLDHQVRYDILMMSIPASPAGVFADLVEVSSIEKSLLRDVSNRINQIKSELKRQADVEFRGKLKNPLAFDIKFSFLKLLSDKTKNEKKYVSHILKVLPQIYTDTYYFDPVLLPAFITKVEYNIRNSEQSFPTLKYDFYLLMKIQKQDNLMQITESKSYAIGQSLGTMSKQFAAWRDDCPIKSFEKSYVGNLTRRITTLDDVAAFCDFLNRKLTMHERVYPDVKAAYLRLVDLLRNFSGEKYNKHHCSLGFFESYYTNDVRKEKQPETEPSNA